MAEEKGKKKVGEIVKTALKFILGIILIVLGLVGVWIWRKDVLILIRGCLGLGFVLAGIICLLIARE